MPGRDYVAAYEAFEGSLGDLSYPRTASPWSSSNASYTNASPDSDWKKYHSRLPPQKPRKGLFASSRQGGVKSDAFPPTPPPHVVLNDGSHDSSVPAFPRDRSRAITPTAMGSLPTPDTTPPSLVHASTPEHFDRKGYASSITESFATAREDQGAHSATASLVGLPLQGAKESSSSRSKGLKNLGWGMGSPDLDDENAGRGDWGPGERGIWSMNSTSKKRRRKTSADEQTCNIVKEHKSQKRPGITFLEDDAAPAEESPDQESNQSSWLEESSTEDLRSAHLTPEQTKGRKPRSSKSKRAPRRSRDSAVVEAMIVESPPLPKGRLRHVTKNGSLRDKATSEKRSSLRTVIPDDFLSSPLGISGNQRSSRAPIFGAPFENSSPFDQSEMRRSNTLPAATSEPRRAQGNPRGVSSTFNTQRRPRPVSESFLDCSTEDTYRMSPEKPGDVRRRTGPERRDQITSPSKRASAPFFATARIGPAPLKAPWEPEFRGVPRELQHLLPPANSATPTDSMLELNPDMPSGSRLRQTYLASPLSMRSEASDRLVVSEAKAVSIYPHNNDSVLIIQNPASSEQSRESSTKVKSLGGSSRDKAEPSPPSTPPDIRQANHSVDSPLRHPRVAPQPPTISVIPPASGQNSQTGTTNSSSVPSRRMSLVKQARRVSEPLVSHISSFTTTNVNSLRQRNGRKRNDAQIPANLLSHSQHHANESPRRTGTLHPSWRPRGFTSKINRSKADSDRSSNPALQPSSALEADPGPSFPGIEPGTSLRRLFGRHAPPSRSNTIPASTNSAPIFGSTSVRRRQRPSHLATNEVDGPDAGNQTNLSSRSVSLRESVNRSASGRSTRSGGGPSVIQGLKDKVQDHSLKREELHRQGRRDRLRNSIGPVFYVEPGSVAGPPNTN